MIDNLAKSFLQSFWEHFCEAGDGILGQSPTQTQLGEIGITVTETVTETHFPHPSSRLTGASCLMDFLRVHHG